jgi:drug/metabolite transporter (DMT)-like permease
MTGWALTLVLVAAAAHAGWNYVLKRATGGPAFMTLVALVAAVLWAPVALVVWQVQDYRFAPVHLVPIAASAAIHTAYFLLLDRGYRSGDLSVVYPLARATGPLLTILVAILVLGERPGPVALAGGLAVVLGAWMLAGNPLVLLKRTRPRATGFALLTGATIALYTVVDKIAVSRMMIPPVVFDWTCLATRVCMLLPFATHGAAGGAALARAWAVDRRAIVAVAILSPLAYILVLTAMVFTPVSYVAPAREMSILFAALLGTHFLAERDAARRLTAALAITAGVIALALG